jgi:hypothetical protein
VARFGVPASTLTDNEMVLTTRFAGGRGGRNALKAELRRWDVEQKPAARTSPPLAARSSGSSRR